MQSSCPPREEVQRQIAVVPVVAVKEAAFLLAVHGINGRIEIEENLGGCRRVRLHEEVREEPIHRGVIRTRGYYCFR